MSNVSAAQAFQGIDDASVTDRYPKLPPSGKFRVKVLNTELVQGSKAGLTFVIEHTVEENLAGTPAVVGNTYSTTITGLDSNIPHNKKLKLGRVKQFIAAGFGYDPASAQKWNEIAVYVAEKNAMAMKELIAETGPVTAAQVSGQNYIPVTFSPVG